MVDEYKAHDKAIEKKEELLDDFMQTESTQLGQTLALQSSKYMVAAWRVTGEPKEEVAKVVDKERLDYELFDRWLKFLAKPPRFYQHLTKWQEMIKSGGDAAEAKKLADEFQTLVLEVMFERKEVNDENDVIKAKALSGTKKKERGEAAERLRHQRRFLSRLRPRAQVDADRAAEPLHRRLPARPPGRFRSRRRHTT